MNRIRSLSYVWRELRRAGLFGWFFHKDIFEKETEIKTIFFKELNRIYISGWRYGFECECADPFTLQLSYFDSIFDNLRINVRSIYLLPEHLSKSHDFLLGPLHKC